MNPISEVFKCDCMEYMKDVPDKFFDLSIVDPPYGIGISKNETIGRRKKDKVLTNYKSKYWDNKQPEKHYFDELFRISKNCIIWGANYFTQYIPTSSSWIVWDKNISPNLTFSQFELAYTSYKYGGKIIKINRSKWCNCVSNNDRLAKINQKIHPTQKPVELYGLILKKYAKEGDKIFDSHLGSQSSRIAAYKLGFDFWGCELDPDYFKSGCERFEKECNGIITLENGKTITQQSLF